MTNKQIIIDGVDVSKCPAIDIYNIFGIKDKPCCYKFHEYCSTIPNCYFKELKRVVHKLQAKEQALDDVDKYLDAQQKYFDGEDYHNLLDIINKAKEI